MAAKQSERIKLWGIVQGVGFRPYVAKTAEKLGMKGNVLNIGGLVEITVTDTPERISAFLNTLTRNKPAPAEIVHIKRERIEYTEFNSFDIINSGDGDEDETAMIPADLAICPDCLNELYDKNDPRYQHPFISCMVCGPRYTIIDRIPYDRCNTSMMDFPMCEFCESEYTELNDRRYHAQTISCHSCGPALLWKDRQSENVGVLSKGGKTAKAAFYDKAASERTPLSAGFKDGEAILDHAAELLQNGGVLLFKSVGGYNLIANPLSKEAVSKLRSIKRREEKPFAVMFRSMEQIKAFCHVDSIEEKLLTSSTRPILLLEHRLNEDGGNVFDKIFPSERSSVCTDELKRSRFIGSFLPGFAAQYMLLDRISPLIFTSANLSDMPMICDDNEAFEMLEKHLEIDGMIYNLRKIRVRVDDSVARVIDSQPQIIRRSKGYAPIPLFVNTDESKNSHSQRSLHTPHITHTEHGSHIPPQIFAAGGQLKNSFALTKGNFVYMSQFFGDMDTTENQAIYRENAARLGELFKIKPSAAACDLHPLYFTTQLAEEYSRRSGLPLIKVQHHHAHTASVMAENDLKGKVIGVSFDGTGYGSDGNIWGGEFFLCEKAEVRRIAHLRYVDMVGGDSSVKDAARSALSYIHAYDTAVHTNEIEAPCPHTASSDNSISITVELSDILDYGRERLLSKPEAALVTAALKAGVNTVKSSSMGRLFDAVSALLNIKDYNDYEGQCAIMLEDAAAFALKNPKKNKACDLAFSFHERIIDMILTQCRHIREEYGAEQVALSGGTFQNKILMEGALNKLRADGFKPYYNISVSPNDGGIALGQAYVAMHSLP